MWLYYIFLLSYFGIGWANIQKNSFLNSRDIIKIWKNIRKTIIINLGIIAPLFFYCIDNRIDYGSINYTNIFTHFLIFMLNWIFYEITTYFVHRLLHHSKFYFLHKKTHSIGNRIGISLYNNFPVDFLFLQILPLYLGLIMMKGHIFIYLYFTVLETYYRMGRINRDVGIFHRRNMNGNFGIDLFMDKLLKTSFKRKIQ